LLGRVQHELHEVGGPSPEQPLQTATGGAHISPRIIAPGSVDMISLL